MNQSAALLKQWIEDGDSIIEAYEKVDLDLMRQEGDVDMADRIAKVLALVTIISDELEI